MSMRLLHTRCTGPRARVEARKEHGKNPVNEAKGMLVNLHVEKQREWDEEQLGQMTTRLVNLDSTN